MVTPVLIVNYEFEKNKLGSLPLFSFNLLHCCSYYDEKKCSSAIKVGATIAQNKGNGAKLKKGCKFIIEVQSRATHAIISKFS
jgi:hypothetical protein